MKKNFGIILSIALGLSALLLTIAFQAGWVKANPFNQKERAEVGALISYQGNIFDGDSPFNGTGYFKFAVINATGSMTYWSNNHTSVAGSEPTAAVPLTVNNGLFNVILGDTSGTYANMTEIIGYTTFDDYNTLLRVWFSPDNGTFTQMPDQKVAAVPYALQAVESVFAWNADSATSATTAGYASEAGRADTADLFDGLSADWFQKRVDGTCPAGYAASAVNSDGSLECEPFESKPVFSVTTIEGTSASRGRYNSMTIGVDGLALLSYYDDTGNSLMVAHCKDIACTTFTTATIDDPASADVGKFPSITIGRDGLGIISYTDTTNQTVKVAHCNDIQCSSAEIQVLASLGPYGESTRTSIAINNYGYPLISYYYGTSTDLRLTQCTDLTCSGSIFSYTIDSTNDVGNYQSMVVGQHFAVIAHFDRTNSDLRLSYFSLSSSTSSTIVLDDGPGIGRNPAITLGADGFPIIAYFDLHELQLKAVHCDEFLCSTFTTHKLIDLYGSGTSIAIGVDGLPVISFYQPDLNDLRFIKCTSIDCSSPSLSVVLINNLDTAVSLSSITIGMDGNPLVSYFDNTNQDLFVVHCSSTTCQPYYRGR